MNDSSVRVVLLGCGTVGSSLLALLDRQRSTIAMRTGLTVDVTRVAVRDLARSRRLSLPDGVLTDDAMAIATEAQV